MPDDYTLHIGPEAHHESMLRKQIDDCLYVYFIGPLADM